MHHILMPGEFNFTFNNDVKGKTLFDESHMEDWLKLGQLKYVEEYEGRYDNGIYYMDYCLNNLFEYLKSKNIYDNSLIILFSDHGEEFYEHKLFNHGYTVYREALEVPLYIKFPGNKFAGKRIKDYVQTLSLYPTIADYMNLDYRQISSSLFINALFIRS